MKKLSVANGTYINREGQQKTNWVSVGIIGTTQAGKEYMLIDPTINFAGFQREAGKDMVMVGIFEESAQGQGGQGYAPPAPQYNQPPAQGQHPPQGQPPAYGGQTPPAQNNPPIEYYDAQGNPVPARG